VQSDSRAGRRALRARISSSLPLPQGSIAGLASSLGAAYNISLLRIWPAWIGAAFLGLLNVGMTWYNRPWSTYSGLQLWGYTILDHLGLHYWGILPSPFQDTVSVIDIGLLLGAFSGAHLAREFAIRGATRREYAKGLGGGVMMGIGASLAAGCTVGGFLSPVSSLALAGFIMMAGLIVGAYAGAKFLQLEVSRFPPKVSPVAKPEGRAPRYNYRAMPIFGALLIGIVVLMAYSYTTIGFADQGGFLVFGFLIGVVLQRSKWCLASAFREPFLSGDARYARAGFLTALIGLAGITVLKVTGVTGTYVFVIPVGTQDIIGGVIFGFGMVMAGGCASGTLWRVGEGHLKLWVALVGFIFGAGLLPTVVPLETFAAWTSGPRVFIPDLMGYGLAFLLVVGLLVLWYLSVSLNQARRESKSLTSVLTGGLPSMKFRLPGISQNAREEAAES
jgi:uncharacterized protein